MKPLVIDWVKEEAEVVKSVRNAGINLTGYHLPGLTPVPLIFPSKSPPPGQRFSAKLRPPGRKNETKIPTPGHDLPSSNAKISMKRNIIL